MDKMAIMVCLDGCGPEYLNASRLPFIQTLKTEGYFSIGHSMIPSITNVNAVSIITGKYPEEHGITTNYFYDRKTGREVYMESPDFIKGDTLLEQFTKMGLRTALLTAKDKLRTLLNRGTNTSFSAENPLPWIRRTVGPPPPIYSVDVDIWLMKALRALIKKEDYNLIFVMTTDYTMHKHAPHEEESKRHMEKIDETLRESMEILESNSIEPLFCITADHGMSQKNRALNLEQILQTHGISSKMNTVIADRYVVHHQNLSGAAYIYLKKARDTLKGMEVLRETEGVESVLPLEQACKLYHLDKTRIGDLLVLGKKNYVFGHVQQAISEVSIRSHGSLHERRIPIIMNLPASELEEPPCENRDLASLVLNWYQK